MEGELNWIKNMKHSVRLDEVNPHFLNPEIQSYLLYYRFAVEQLNEYRCGFIDVNEKKIFLQFFLKDNPVGTVFFVHGYLDHSGGLSRTINYLLKENYQVIALDLPGHGFSEGEDGVVSSFQDYLIAIEKSYAFIQKIVKTSEIYGIGHSTGAALLFHASSQRKISLNGLVLVAPLFYPFKWNLVKGFLLFIGKIFSQKKRAFKKNSEDRVYREFIKQDPLQVKVLKAEWVRSMNEWQTDIQNCSKLEQPVYYIQGTKDTTLDWRRNIEFYQKKCLDLRVAIFPRGRHQLLNERPEIRELVHLRVASVLKEWVSTSE